MDPTCTSAWNLIGFDPCDYDDAKGVRIVGGRTIYEAVGNDGGTQVRLSRLAIDANGLHPIIRYVDPDTLMEIIR